MGGLFSKPAAPAPPAPVKKVQKEKIEKVDQDEIEERQKIAAKKRVVRTGGLRLLQSPMRVAEQEQKTKLGIG